MSDGSETRGRLRLRPRCGWIGAALLALVTGTAACVGGRPLRVGPELQAYPAGVIPGLHVQQALDETDALLYRVAANVTDRRDYGEHDDEEGDGFGGGVGWRRYETAARTGWLWGGRVDLWRFEINWRDDGPPLRRGSSKTWTLQPSLEGGHAWSLGDGWSMEVTLGIGAEINVDTEGEGVGEGAIGLLGFTLLRSF
jgi:hypothetical protein